MPAEQREERLKAATQRQPLARAGTPQELAATISIALVILRVLSTLLILPRISFDPAIVASVSVPRRRPERLRGLRERY